MAKSTGGKETTGTAAEEDAKSLRAQRDAYFNTYVDNEYNKYGGKVSRDEIISKLQPWLTTGNLDPVNYQEISNGGGLLSNLASAAVDMLPGNMSITPHAVNDIGTKALPIMQTAIPAIAGLTTGIATGGLLGPVLGGGLLATAATGATAATTANGVSNIAHNDPFLKNAGQAAAIGAVTGGLSGVASPITNTLGESISGVTGLSNTAADTIAGGLTGSGISAGTQYALTGQVNPIQTGVAGFMGGAKGYSTGAAADTALNSDSLYAQDFGKSGLSPTDLGLPTGADAQYHPYYELPDYTMQPSHGLGDGSAGLAGRGDNFTFDMRGDSPSLTDNNSGLVVDQDLYPGFDPSYSNNLGYDAVPERPTLFNNRDTADLNFAGGGTTPNAPWKNILGIGAGLLGQGRRQQGQPRISIPGYNPATQTDEYIWQKQAQLAGYDQIVNSMETGKPQQLQAEPDEWKKPEKDNLFGIWQPRV